MKKALLIVAIATAIFTVAMILVYLHTGMEMTTLTDRFYTAVVIELGGLLLKAIVDNIGRKKDDNDD